ncbi:retrovirus-related pol polyprotein from transposon TNT 1-94 [Tanacetum coccineum]
MDRFGPITPRSINHEKYTLIIVDEYSRCTWVYFLKKKSHAPETIMSFIKRVENQNDIKVKQLRTNNGIEFKNSIPLNFCHEKGISQNFSFPNTPEQNGVVERKNKTLIEAVRTMLSSATSAHECLFVDFLSEEEPKKVSEAFKHLGWVDVIQEELNQYASSDLNGQTGQNAQSVQIDEILNDDHPEHSNHTNDKQIIDNLPNTKDVQIFEHSSSPRVEDTSVQNTIPILNPPLPIPSVVTDCVVVWVRIELYPLWSLVSAGTDTPYLP